MMKRPSSALVMQAQPLESNLRGVHPLVSMQGYARKRY
jgi:hypothetical protein